MPVLIPNVGERLGYAASFVLGALYPVLGRLILGGRGAARRRTPGQDHDDVTEIRP
jgi:hypothetical protein